MPGVSLRSDWGAVRTPLRASFLARFRQRNDCPNRHIPLALPNYPDETLVHLIVEGLIEVTPDEAASYFTDARGRQWSWNMCVEGMKLVYGDGWNMWKPYNGCQPNQGYSPQASFSEYMIMWGTSYAQWDGGFRAANQPMTVSSN